MKANSLLSFFIFLLTQIAFSQQLPREMLYGQIVADSLSIENVAIMNSSTSKTVASDNKGFFNIAAREKDTLIFSSLVFNSKRVVLTAADFKMKLIRVKLEISITNLDEVVISPHWLTGSLEIDHKNIKIPELPKIDIRLALIGNFEDDEQSSPDNTAMPGYVDMTYMAKIDLQKLTGKLLRLFQKPREKKTIVFISEKIFAEAVREMYSDDFFVYSLQIQKNKIGLFLNFCENELDVRRLLDPKNEIELIDFLIEKSKQFKQVPKE